MKKVLNSVFFNKYEQKDIVKYKKIFLIEIKLLLLYFVKFFDNEYILNKICFNNYIVKKSN